MNLPGMVDYGLKLKRYLAKQGSLDITRLLGPLHMIPVDRDSPVTEISLDSYFLCKKFDVFTASSPGVALVFERGAH